MDAKEYWGEVRQEIGKIEGLLSKGAAGQPPVEEGCVYIISRRNREKNTTAGSVSLAPVRLAAQRIVDGTHELASEDQINKFLGERRADHERNTAVEVSRKQQFIVNVTPGQQPVAASTPVDARPRK